MPTGKHGSRTRAHTRIWNKFAVGDGCWEWTAHRKPNGYGAIADFIDGKPRDAMAHRVLYEVVVGPIPEGLEIDHLCRNRICVRPDHLEPVTHAVNVDRGGWRLRTHCKHGHPFDEDNTRWHQNHRHCKACRRTISARSRQTRRTHA